MVLPDWLSSGETALIISSLRESVEAKRDNAEGDQALDFMTSKVLPILRIRERSGLVRASGHTLDPIMRPCLLDVSLFHKPLFSPDTLAVEIKYSFHLISVFTKNK